MIFSFLTQEVLHSMCCGSDVHFGSVWHRHSGRVVHVIWAARHCSGGGSKGGPNQGKDHSSVNLAKLENSLLNQDSRVDRCTNIQQGDNFTAADWERVIRGSGPVDFGWEKDAL